jgi:uncharacterized protein YajQ (UPF0234 family)
MADTYSFDIVSDVDMQEVDNAMNQARKEIIQRYDFKGSKSSIELKEKEHQIVLVSDDDFKMKAVIDILQSKFVKRGIPLKALTYGTLEQAAGGTVRQTITLQNGIDKENGKLVVKMIKDSKLKVQAQIMDDQVRVSGKSKDDLQSVMNLVRSADLSFAVQFKNYR